MWVDKHRAQWQLANVTTPLAAALCLSTLGFYHRRCRHQLLIP